MNGQPQVSVVIVNYNSVARACRCVASVLAESERELECLVVDNGSADGSVEQLRVQFRDDVRVRVVPLDRNYGPAYARNRGVEAARGEYVAFLDNDTVVTPRWLDQPLRRMAEDPSIGACQCKLVLMDDPQRIDYVGDYLGSLGFLVLRAESGSRDAGQWGEEVEIFSAKSAGMVARKQAVLDAGLFDEDYFIYVEETDLDWRMWLRGYRVIYCPQSVVTHEYSTSRVVLGAAQQTRLVKFHGCKNYILTLVKNLGGRRLAWMLPLHVSLWVGLAGFEMLRGQFRSGGWILRGLGWNLARLGDTLRKRRRVQKARVSPDRALWPRIYRRVTLMYYLRKLCAVPDTGHAKGL